MFQYGNLGNKIPSFDLQKTSRENDGKLKLLLCGELELPDGVHGNEHGIEVTCNAQRGRDYRDNLLHSNASCIPC